MMRIEMKRVLHLTLIFALCLPLFSCASIYGYSEPEDRFLVSALGFDESEGKLAVCARIVTENSPEVKLFHGFGDSVEYAMSHIEGADSRQLEIGHLAVVVLGEGIALQRLFEIFDYCASNDDVTVGVRFASTYRASDLLSLSDGDGYTLTGALREGREGSGYSGGCKLYELENQRISLGKGAFYHLPYFSVSNEEYSLNGLKIYTSNGTVRLDRGESAYYMMLTDEFSGGAFDFEYDGKGYSVFVSSCRTDCYIKDGKAYITCKAILSGELLPTADVREISKSCTERALELCEELFFRYGDIFGIEKRTGESSASLEGITVTVEFMTD